MALRTAAYGALEKAVIVDYGGGMRATFLVMLFLGQVFMISFDSCAAPDTDGFAAARRRMVAEQFSGGGRTVTDKRVLAALLKVPRHEYVPKDQRSRAYEDCPLPIGYGQTISQPYIVGFMTEVLNLKPSDRVLEVGTGSGYQAAVLAELAREVYSVEIIKDLAERAENTLQRLGVTNVHVRAGDGYKGWPEAAPFDAIIVTCAPDKVPGPLLEQLKEGGKMIVPVGGYSSQDLVLLQKRGGKLSRENVLPVRFVPMTGEAQKVQSDR